MEFISNIPVLGGFLGTVLPFLLVISIVVFIHEYGHYIVGRWCGIHAVTFSLGFGKRLFSWTDKRGTLWQVAALPLGGYVKFLGDADGSSRADPEELERMNPTERARSFHGAAVWKRMLAVLAGPVANFILSAVVFAGLYMWEGEVKETPTIGSIAGLPADQDVGLQGGDEILAVNGEEITAFGEIYRIAQDMETPGPMTFTVRRDGDVQDVIAPYALPPLVLGVEPLSPASRAGLKRNDYIASANGETLVAFRDLRRVVMASGDQTIPLEVIREGERIALDITPIERDTDDGQGGFEKRVMINVSGGTAYIPATETPAPWTALWRGVERVYEVIALSLNGLKHIILGNLSAENLQGPLGIAQISGETATQSATSFVMLIAVISTAIGMLNLFPIPVLDGGHLVIFGYEAIAGRPPAEKYLQVAMSIGLALVLMLMVFATYNDITRWLFVS